LKKIRFSQNADSLLICWETSYTDEYFTLSYSNGKHL